MVWESNVVPWGPPRNLPAEESPTTPTAGLVMEGERDEEAASPLASRLEKAFLEESSSRGRDIQPASKVSFLALPLEVRLQIYGWLHLSSPVPQAQLAPWYPNPFCCNYFLQAVSPNLVLPQPDAAECAVEEVQSGGGSSDYGSDGAGRRRLLSPHRPLCGLPTALLQSCRRVYDEARLVPFWENEFRYVNWFSTGLAGARAHVKRFQPWQRDGMRWVRLAIHSRDPSAQSLEDWRTVCAHWARGLRGLRLKVAVGSAADLPGARAGKGDAAREEGEGRVGEEEEEEEAKAVGQAVVSGLEWLEEGLAELRGLRNLEMELDGDLWSNAAKVAWCEKLSGLLNDAPRESEVCVTCVEERWKKAPAAATWESS